MRDMLGRMWKGLMVFAMFTGHVSYGQMDSPIPCPVSLTSGYEERDSIKLEFRNKGKQPVEEVDLSCSPAADRKNRGAICHSERGIFYPGNEYWIEIDYPGAHRNRSTLLAVKEVRLAGGVIWESRKSDACKTLRVSAKR